MGAVELIDKAIAAVDALLAPSVQPAPADPAPAPAPKKAAAPKPKQPAASAPAASDPGPDAARALFSKALIKVAKIVSVEALANSEKLYKLQVDLGNGDNRQICAGLRLFLEPGDLQDAVLCVFANLKPAKLAGELSEGMILAAEHEVDGKLVVRTLIPPAGASPGDVVFLDGGAATEAPAKQLKTDDFKQIGAQLCVGSGGKACFAGIPFVTAHGPVTLPALIPDGASIH